MILRLLLTAAAAAALSAGPGAAQAPAARPVRVLKYLTPADIDPARLIPPPPAETSDITKAEIADLHRIIDAKTPERMAQAHWDDEHEDPSVYYATIGGGFDVKTLPATAEVLAIIKNDASIAGNAGKTMYRRNRPWQVDSTIPTCNPEDKPGTSYPSGHATLGYSLAMTLAELIPAKAHELMARADDYAFSRQLCGSHYASDTRASQAIAAAFVTALMKDPEFQAKLEASRAELRAAKFTD